MPVEMTPVNSSNVASVGYDAENQEMHVVFHKTGLYVYHNVTGETWRGVIGATSIGRFLSDFVKPAHGHRKG